MSIVFSMKGKQEISSKYHQLFKKCNSQYISISCVVQLIDFNQMDSVMPALETLWLYMRDSACRWLIVENGKIF